MGPKNRQKVAQIAKLKMGGSAGPACLLRNPDKLFFLRQIAS